MEVSFVHRRHLNERWRAERRTGLKPRIATAVLLVTPDSSLRVLEGYGTPRSDLRFAMLEVLTVGGLRKLPVGTVDL
jgi:hypothetical protein